MNTSIGIVLANSLWFVPVALLAVVLFKAAMNGYKQYRFFGRSDIDCPPDHVCVRGRCIPESKLEELISSMA